jgi:hypothetical protein
VENQRRIVSWGSQSLALRQWPDNAAACQAGTQHPWTLDQWTFGPLAHDPLVPDLLF